jgi:hypothetical protein
MRSWKVKDHHVINHLGYKGEDTHAEAITSKKHEVSPSKKEDNVAKQPSTQGKENFKRTKKGRHQEAILGTQNQRYFSWALLFM